MRALALTLETIAGHTSTEGKVQAAAAYLASQEDGTVAVAARCLAGSPLPPGAPATQVGSSTLVDLVAAFAGAERRELIQRATLLGDLGLAVAERLEDMPREEPPLALTEVAAALERMGTLGTLHRHRLLEGLLRRSTPLEAKYLTKLLLGSLRTGMQAARVEEALALAFDQPPSLVRRSHMLLGDIGETARRAAIDALADVGLRAFRPVRVMLAHPADSADEVLTGLELPLIGEHKYDGIRAQLHVRDGQARIFSRAREEITHTFPELRDLPSGLDDEWILDGEVAAWVDGRALSFSMLQQRLGRKQVSLTLLLDAPVVFLAFDVLRGAGEDLLDEPLQQRKRALEILPPGGPIRRVPWRLIESEAELREWFERTRRAGNEGAVFKDPRSPYRPGRRGRAWMKLKPPTGTLDVVVTGAEYGLGKRAGQLSDLVFAVRGSEGWLDTGRAFSGLTDPEIAEMTEELMASTVRRNGASRTVEPRIVLEVTFDAVTASERHPSGYALRFPRIVRRRRDLDPREVSTVEDLRRLADGGRT